MDPDVTIIEIIESDNIPKDKYLSPDLNYKNEEVFNDYLYIKNFILTDILELMIHILNMKMKSMYLLAKYIKYIKFINLIMI